MAAVIKYHKLGGWRQQKFILPQKSELKVLQGWAPSRGSRGGCFLSLAAPGAPGVFRLVAVWPQSLPLSSCDFSPCVSACLSQSRLPLIRTPVLALGPILNDLILIWLHLRRLYPQIRSLHRFWGLGLWNVFFWRHHSSLAMCKVVICLFYQRTACGPEHSPTGVSDCVWARFQGLCSASRVSVSS